jgi:hypothetical protein
VIMRLGIIAFSPNYEYKKKKNIRKGKDIFVDKIIREGKDGFWKEYEKSKKIRDEKRKILAVKSKLLWKPKVDK